LFLIKIITFLV